MALIQKDYYKILGVKSDASETEIKRAFRKKAKELHPDTGIREKKSEPAVREIITAYQILSSKRSRQEYDREYFSKFETKFNYREFLRGRRDDLQSQAKLVFFDLLHRHEKDALELYRELDRNDEFSLEELLGTEDFMDCAFLLSEEFEKQRDYIPTYHLLLRISELENEKQYFKHFMKDVQLKIKEILCKKLNGKIPTDRQIGYIEKIIALENYEKEKPVYLKKIAELYSEMGKVEKARYYCNKCLSLKPKLPGLEGLRKKLA